MDPPLIVKYSTVGDDAFPLQQWLMKPFPSRHLTDEERKQNYRLSQARRIVENAFGILANRFRCLLSTLHQEVETVKSIVIASVCLHNLMRMRYPGIHNAFLDREGENHEHVPGAWRQDRLFVEIDNVTGPTSEMCRGKRQRLLLKHYYNSAVGAVPWQQDML